MTRTKYLLICMAAPALAQKHDLGLLLGREVVSNRTGLDIAGGTSFNANYAQRLMDAKLASLYVEIPFAATPQHAVTAKTLTVPKDFASLFLTPGLKIKFGSILPVVPYVAAGAGYAQFEQSVSQQDGKANTGPRRTHTGAFDAAAGVEIKLPLPWIRLRGEIRDFISGNPALNAPPAGKQHNVVIGGGFGISW